LTPQVALLSHRKCSGEAYSRPTSVDCGRACWVIAIALSAATCAPLGGRKIGGGNVDWSDRHIVCERLI